MNEKRIITLQDAKALFKTIPLYVEEIDDYSELYEADNQVYTKKVNPFLAKTIVETSPVLTIIDTIAELVPVYIRNSVTYYQTRDPAYLEVHSGLQNEFWKTFFRDCWGAEYNHLLIEAHNKLRFTALGEEQIIFSEVFPKFLTTEDGSTELPVVFNYENSNTIDILKDKLSATYAFLNYEFTFSNFIDVWLESLYLKGELSYEEKLREYQIYAIQDIRNELLRRKFAGSTSFYTVLLSAINRRGSYVPTVPLKSVTQNGLFRDNRQIRALDFPGITTIAPPTIIDPIAAFSSIIPQRQLISLYYTSNAYDSDSFWLSPSNYLRMLGKSFAWDNIQGILDASLVRKTYPRMDTTNPATAQPYTLDSSWKEKGETVTLQLDAARDLFGLSYINSAFFDIQVDQILFHKNSLEKVKGFLYEYATYPISGTGPSMMDVPWIDFVEKAVSRKKKVQEKVTVGVQLSKYLEIPSNALSENFYVITYSDTFSILFDAQNDSISDTSRYAYIWNIQIIYNRDTFEVLDVKKKLVTYLLFLVNENSLPESVRQQAQPHPSYEIFTTQTSGIIPFAYENLTINSYIMKLDATGIQDDFYEEGYNKAIFLFTPNKEAIITKKYIHSSPGELTKSLTTEWYYKPIDNDRVYYVIFGIQRIDEFTKKTYWQWSEGIPVYPKSISNLTYFKPDWLHNILEINPYLNFTEKSASSLRHKDVPLRALRPSTLEQPNPEVPPPGQLQGPGSYTALTNLSVWHGYKVYNNISGLATDPAYPRGSYIRKIRRSNITPENEKFEIWGDNRALWGTPYTADPLDDWDNDKVRTRAYYDANGVPCIKLNPGVAYVAGSKVDSYYVITPGLRNLPDDPSGTISPDTSWSSWVWNDPGTSGLTCAFDITIQNSTENQWLISRKEINVAGMDITAEFDLYYSNSGNFVFKIYPTGNESGFTFQASLSAAHAIQKRTNLVASYFIEKDTTTPDKLNIIVSLIAGNRWTATYYSVVTVTSLDYNVYETSSSFDISGLTPTLVSLNASFDYNAGYPIGESYRFGHLIKYQGQATNALLDICLLNQSYGYNPFQGYLYDFRLYNYGMTLEEALILSRGSKRELYSYSPSIYRLTYASYIDFGITKRNRRVSDLSPETIGKVRLFTRNVWDSALVDTYMLLPEEKTLNHELYRPDWRDPLDDTDIYDGLDYKDGVVEQLLVNNYETYSDVEIDINTKLYYKGNQVETAFGDKFSLVQTTIYPIQYKNELFTSKLVLKQDLSVTDKLSFKAYHSGITYEPLGAHSASLPSVPSGDTLEYSAILDINFKVTPLLEAASPLVRGPNILINYHSKLQDFVVKHDVSLADYRSVGKNYIVYPMYIPYQGEAETALSWNARFVGITLSKIQLSSAIATFLSAKTYYGEFQVPYAYQDTQSPTGYSYTSRWTAVKGLSDGEYYFTCKYPIQILPFDNVRQTQMDKVPVLYAATRLKVVVSSKPRYYSEAPISEYRPIWDTSEYTPQEVTPEDNRLFPHREVNIDVYSLFNASASSEEWTWKKILSNWDTTTGVESIKDASSIITINQEIPFYITTNYFTPFFIRNPVDDTQVVSDIMTIIVKNSFHKEVLSLTSLNDITTLTLVSGKSYKILFDYSAYVSEISYSNDIFTDTTQYMDQLSVQELQNYLYCTSLLELKTPSYLNQNILKDITHINLINWSNEYVQDFNLTSTKTGYAIGPDGNWIPYNTDINANNLALGDPYSNALSKNGLIDIYEDNRDIISRLGYFSYRQENITISEAIAPKLFGSLVPSTGLPLKTKIVSKSPVGTFVARDCTINEFAIVSQIQKNKIQAVIDAITSLTSTTYGLIQAFSKISPFVKAVSYYSNNESITPINHKLKAYKLQPFIIRLSPYSTKNTKKGLFSSNLVASQNILNTSLYTIGGAIVSYAYDAIKNKDVFDLNTKNSSEITITYLGDPGNKALYNIALSLKTPVSLNIEVLVYSTYNNWRSNISSWSFTGTNVTILDAWTTWGIVTPSAIDPRIITIKIKKSNASPFANEHIQVNKLFIRKANKHTHLHGFSDAAISSYNAVTLGLRNPTISGTTVLLFENMNTGSTVPFQVKNKLLSSNPQPTFLSYADLTSTFIYNNIPQTVNTTNLEFVELIRPWTRKLLFIERTPRNVALYRYINSPKGVVFSKSSVTGDIFEVYNDVADNPSIRYNALYNDIEYTGPYGLVVNYDKIKDILDTNLQLDLTTIPVIEERFSMVGGCFNPDKLIAKEPSVVGVTNIQLLDNDDVAPAILHEFEYFPIIYDESRHHLSLNFLLKTVSA